MTDVQISQPVYEDVLEDEFPEVESQEISFDDVLNPELRCQIRKLGGRDSKLKLDLAYLLIDYFAENKNSKDVLFVKEVYKEAAKEFGCEARTMRGYVEPIRRLPREDVEFYFPLLPFQHFVVSLEIYETQSEMDEVEKSLLLGGGGNLAKSPREILDRAYGNGPDGGNMTIEEVKAFYRGPGYDKSKTVGTFSKLRTYIPKEHLKEFDEFLEKVRTWIR
jgi:hypothetical protein